MPRVSPSRSLNLLFSGWIFDVSMGGADVTTWAHHSILFDLSRWMETSLPEGVVSSVQVDSSG
jgi:hypothetical protein